ncbi:MAG TPA: class I SAM-dependent methyltransferase [Polyangiaceae bacterium]
MAESTTPATPPPSPLSTPEPWDLIRDGYVAELWEQFSRFAASALELSELPEGADVIDVATGPGTLALQAARRARRVVGVDFAARMLEALERRARETGVTNVEAIQADGQALPFPDASFDRGYSMFGLIFFPDRGRGFRELRRVLRPGGRVAVSSWRPFAHVPPLRAAFDALAELMPELPFGASKAPLGEPEDFELELREAGFEAVQVHVVAHAETARDPRAFWASMVRSSAPFALLRKRLGEERFSKLYADVEARLVERFGSGPLELDLQALIGLGTKGA